MSEWCESCSEKLGALSTLYIRGEVDREEWVRRAYKGVAAHHPDWSLSDAWGYARTRAPFYPFDVPGLPSRDGVPLPEPAPRSEAPTR